MTQETEKVPEAAIDTIIFDVGWVLVELDFQPLMGCLRQARPDAEAQPLTMKEVIAAINLEAHERGEFSGATLVDRLHGLVPAADRTQVKRSWLEMFTPVEEMFDLARALGERYRVHLLSNVGDLHWAHLNNRFDLRRLVDDALPSYQAGVMKPHSEIYRLAEERFELEPERTVFVDDLEANVLAAQLRGWYAIQHQSPRQTMQGLRELGVEW